MEIFLSAFVGAVFSTIPIGPINLILMQRMLERRWSSWIVGVSAAILADGTVCIISLNFFDFVKVHVEPFVTYSPLLLSVFLAASGLAMFFSKPLSDKTQYNRSSFGFFIFCFFLTLSGPALLPFWLSWWSTLHFAQPNTTTVALGFVLGDFTIFALYASLVVLFPKPGFEMQKKVSKGLAIFLVFAGLVVFVSWVAGYSPWTSISQIS